MSPLIPIPIPVPVREEVPVLEEINKKRFSVLFWKSGVPRADRILLFLGCSCGIACLVAFRYSKNSVRDWSSRGDES